MSPSTGSCVFLDRKPAVRPIVLAMAAALALLAAAPGQAQYYSFSGAVGTWGGVASFPPDPAVSLLDLTGNTLVVGLGALGSFSAMSGAQLMADSLSVGNGLDANGSFTATGAGTVVTLSGVNVNRLDIGAWGNAAVTVSAGALIDASQNVAACGISGNYCGSQVGSVAGSSAVLTITGQGSTVLVAGRLNVGNTWVGGGNGTPGGTSQGTVNVLAGGTLRTNTVSLSQVSGPSTNGNEQSLAQVLVDGGGSQWVITSNAAMAQVASATVGDGAHSTAKVTVSNGASWIIDGTAGAPTDYVNLQIGNNGGQGSVTITGAGSQLQVLGGNAATIAIGASGSFSVLSGASVQAGNLTVGDGSGGNGMGQATVSGANTFVSLNGASGRLEIGSNVGTGSLLVSDGAILDATGNTALCSQAGSYCNNDIGQTAGSTGSLMVTGQGSTVRLLDLNVGNVNTGPNWGKPGATSQGSVQITQGGTLQTMQVTLGGGWNNSALNTGTEQSFTNVIIDGAGSRWTSTADTVSNYGAGFTIAAGPLAQSLVTVSNGGGLVLDGSASPSGYWSTINVGTNGGHGELDVTSAGSVQTAGTYSGISLGSYTSGTGSVGVMKVLSAGQVTAGFINVADGPGASGTLTVSGTGSLVTLNSNTVSSGRMNVGNNGQGQVLVSQGGVIDAAGNLSACSAVGGSCDVRVGTSAGSSGTLVITDPGSRVNTGDFHVSTAWVDTNLGSAGGTSQGTVQVLAGGQLNTEYADVATVWGGPLATGSEHAVASVLLDGAGSSWNIGADTLGSFGAALTVGGGANTQGSVTVQNGARLTLNGTGTLAYPGDSIAVGLRGGAGSLVVTGAGSQLVMPGVDPAIFVGYAVSAGTYGPTQSQLIGTGSFSLLAGATATTHFLAVGSYSGVGSLLLDGAGTQLTQSGVDATNGDTAFAVIGLNGGTGTGAVSNGAKWLISDGGQDSRASSSNNPGLELGKGGAGASGSLTITGPGSSVQIVASSLGLPAGTPDNINPFVAVGRDAGTVGSLTVSNGGQLFIVGGALSTAANPRITSLDIGGGSTTFATIGSATVTGAGSQIVLSGNSDRIDVGRGPGSVGSLSVLNQSMVASTSLEVGANGGRGTLTIDDATVALSGIRSDLSAHGAGATIGRDVGGNGSLIMRNGAQFTILNNQYTGGLSLGGDGTDPLGAGTATLSGGSSIQLLGTAAGGIEIGRTGTGTMSLSGASSISAGPGGGIFVGRYAGSTGSLSLNSASSATAKYLGVGASSGADGGNGTVTLGGGSVINVATLEIGRFGVVTGNNARINGKVINRGLLGSSISVGAAPASAQVLSVGRTQADPTPTTGALTINGSYTNAAGGSLVLDIASDGQGGFTTSQLIFTAGSSYDFTGMQVSFDFLGNADPNAFVQSGAFKLDSFLLTQAGDGSTSGLSSTFAPGQSYSTWLAPSQFTATSDSYAISNFSFTPDGTATLSAVPVPEPKVWMMWLAGAIALGWRLRRTGRF